MERVILTHLRIATRKSPLALWQAEYVAAELIRLHPGLTTELVRITTRGDKILDVPLAKVGGKGLFTKEIDEALADAGTDRAVLAMNAVPTGRLAGLSVRAIPDRAAPRAPGPTRPGGALSSLPAGSRFGPSSLRRLCQLKARYPSFEFVSVRGSVQTRLDKVGHEVDAVILAAAGVKRLGIADRMHEFLEPEVMLPAVAQGTLGIQTRDDDAVTNTLLDGLNHADTVDRTRAERAFLATLEGGCQVPIAAYAVLDGDRLQLRGLVGEVDGSVLIERAIEGARLDAAHLGSTLAGQVLDAGGREILARVYAMQPNA